MTLVSPDRDWVLIWTDKWGPLSTQDAPENVPAKIQLSDSLPRSPGRVPQKLMDHIPMGPFQTRSQLDRTSRPISAMMGWGG